MPQAKFHCIEIENSCRQVDWKISEDDLCSYILNGYWVLKENILLSIGIAEDNSILKS